MKAKNINEAWTMAAEIFPTDYTKDDESSSRAGYPIYRSTTRNYCYICELGDRLEINLNDGRTINIWISPEDEQDEISRYIAIKYAAQEHGEQITPHRIENRIKLSLLYRNPRRKSTKEARTMADFYNYIYLDEERETLNEYAAAELLEDVETLSGEELETMKEQAFSHYGVKLDEISSLKERINEIWREIRTNNDLDKIITDQLEKLNNNA